MLESLCLLCRTPQAYDFELNFYECANKHVEFAEDREQCTGLLYKKTNIVVDTDGIRTYGYKAVAP